VQLPRDFLPSVVHLFLHGLFRLSHSIRVYVTSAWNLAIFLNRLVVPQLISLEKFLCLCVPSHIVVQFFSSYIVLQISSSLSLSQTLSHSLVLSLSFSFHPAFSLSHSFSRCCSLILQHTHTLSLCFSHLFFHSLARALSLSCVRASLALSRFRSLFRPFSLPSTPVLSLSFSFSDCLCMSRARLIYMSRWLSRSLSVPLTFSLSLFLLSIAFLRYLL